jgi:hypothetical protein
MKKTIPIAIALCLTFDLQVAHSRTLWEIGKHDTNNAEFALAPGNYAKYQEDGFFVVGSSSAKQAWPYVHPGPHDGWAGADREHTFTILFGVKQSEPAGTCRLVFDLLDAQQNAPPKLRIEVNGSAFEKHTAAGSSPSRFASSAGGDARPGIVRPSSCPRRA